MSLRDGMDGQQERCLKGRTHKFASTMCAAGCIGFGYVILYLKLVNGTAFSGVVEAVDGD